MLKYLSDTMIPLIVHPIWRIPKNRLMIMKNAQPTPELITHDQEWSISLFILHNYLKCQFLMGQ